MHPNVKALLFALLGLGAGAGLVWTLRPAAGATAQAPAAKQMYQCPLHPQIILDHPGDCPICGMALVPMEHAAPKDKGKPVYYRSPMNPSLTSPVPRKDGMGREHLAVFEGDLSHDRTVATCYLPDGRYLSAEMVKAGMAIDWPKFSRGKYSGIELPGIRKKLWRCDARQKGRMPPGLPD